MAGIGNKYGEALWAVTTGPEVGPANKYGPLQPPANDKI